MESKVETRTEEIYRLSNTDPLTSLLNRTAFLKVANKQLAVDGFKQINDSMGHKVGDQVLKEIAERLTNVCTRHLYKCRWGGDEFLILTTYEDEQDLFV